MRLAQLFFAVIVFALLMAINAFGEFYQYTGGDGTIYYTDDLSMIPEDKRPHVQTFESAKNHEVTMKNNQVEKVYSDIEKNENKEPKKEHKSKGIEGQVEKEKVELDAIRKKLRQTYKDLTAKRKALGNPPSENAKSGIKAQYIRNSKELNQQVETYNKLNKEFEQKVKAYNRKNGTE